MFVYKVVPNYKLLTGLLGYATKTQWLEGQEFIFPAFSSLREITESRDHGASKEEKILYY
jgi:hypothetical protein